MIALGLTILAILASLFMAAYIYFPPQFADRYLVSVFNKFSGIFVTVISLLVYFQGRSALPVTQDLRDLFAGFFAVMFEFILLVIFFILRNFWMFRPPKR